ncbi:MAG: hypothetical protein K940chlam9_01052 [Chlamydiae bacterium]|nr:hypothetical protein [Chlamydiota bacterium]
MVKEAIVVIGRPKIESSRECFMCERTQHELKTMNPNKMVQWRNVRKYIINSEAMNQDKIMACNACSLTCQRLYKKNASKPVEIVRNSPTNPNQGVDQKIALLPNIASILDFNSSNIPLSIPKMQDGRGLLQFLPDLEEK